MNSFRNQEALDMIKEKCEEVVSELQDLDIEISLEDEEIEYNIEDEEMAEILESFNHLYNLVNKS